MRTRRVSAPAVVVVVAATVVFAVTACRAGPIGPEDTRSPIATTSARPGEPPVSVVPPAPTPSITGAPSDRTPWTLSLGATSCALWMGEMLPSQRLAAAAQMLTAARSADGQTDRVTDGLVIGFEADVTTLCAENGELTVEKSGEAVYSGAHHSKYSA